MGLERSKITVLGSGTSTGIPVPGCSCAVCRSADAHNRRLRTSCLVRTGKSTIIFDTGPDFRQQALGQDLKALDAVLYTHDHADHTAGIDDLRGYCYLRGGSIPCYASGETIRELRARFSYIFNPDPNYLGAPVPQLQLREIIPGKAFAAAGIRWQPFTLLHGNSTVLGFRSGDFAYCTDCNHIPAEGREILQGIKNLIITGLRFEPHNTHFTIQQSLEIARELGVARTWLIHMTHTVEHATVSAQLPPGVELSYDGLTFDVELESADDSQA